MTKNHPLLTEENVRYWYWIRDPRYSLLDISNKTGASQSTVHRFMVKHGIERRTLSSAHKNARKTEHKEKALQKGVVSMQSPESRKKQGATLKKIYRQRPELVEQNLKNLRKVMEDPQRYAAWKKNAGRKVKYSFDLPEIQHRYEGKGESISDIACVKGCSYSTIKRFLIKNGVAIRTSSEAAKIRCKNKPESRGIRIGKKQKEILTLLYSHSSLFISDLISLLKIDRSHKEYLYARMGTLYKRGFVTRKKEYDKKSKPNNKKKYLYTITPLGEVSCQDIKN